MLSEFFSNLDQMRRESRLSLSQSQFNFFQFSNSKVPVISLISIGFCTFFWIYHMIKGWIKSCITRWAMYWPQAKSVFCRHKKSAELIKKHNEEIYVFIYVYINYFLRFCQFLKPWDWKPNHHGKRLKYIIFTNLFILRLIHTYKIN